MIEGVEGTCWLHALAGAGEGAWSEAGLACRIAGRLRPWQPSMKL